MKRISMLLVAIMSALMLTTPVFAATEAQVSGESSYSELEERDGNASITTISKMETKEEKIEYYTEKCGGNITNGTVLYYLHLIQQYSIPVCFILLVIASLNFFIIGNKKLDKREQGFSMLIGAGLGLIVFQVLPLLFAIIVAGR